MGYLVGFVITVAALTVVAYYFRRRAETSASPWRRAARVEERLVLEGSLESVLARTRAALGEVGTLRDSGEPNTIEAVTARTWKTSGTVVRAEVRPSGRGAEVQLTAWPGAQLFDWGASRRAVASVEERLGRPQLSALTQSTAGM